MRALSPGINDPTTAVHCIDVAGGVLSRLAEREAPAPVRMLRPDLALYAPAPTFEAIVRGALGEVIPAGVSSPPVLGAIVAALARIAERDCEPQDISALGRLAARVARVVDRAQFDVEEGSRLRAALAALMARMDPGACPTVDSVKPGCPPGAASSPALT